MLVACGFFDEDHTPQLRFDISGRQFEDGSRVAKLEAVIDTGFVGFVSLPMEHAFALKLPLEGQSTVRLADGRSVDQITVEAHVRIGDRSERVTAILQPGSSEVLIGVALLRALNLALLVTRHDVLLLDQDSIDDIYPPRLGHLVARDSWISPFNASAA
jgi:clan AA aspartic protease